ncbi:MAG: hypothetical protein LBU87_06745 [Lactobacillales bacterium]|jgi:two-component system osmolarity sensor histidine kinase EnvZ|nr:hypothetical protein [Lactobacillales bacterium]
MKRSAQYTIVHFSKVLLKWMDAALREIRHKILPKSLLFRFLLIILLPLILLQTIVSIFFYDRHWSTISRRLSADVVGEIRIVSDIIADLHPDEEKLDDILKKIKNNLLLDITFYPEQEFNPQLFIKSPHEDLDSALTNIPYPYEIQEIDEQKQSILIQQPEGFLKIIVPKKRFFSSTIYVFLLWMIGSSILLFWIAFLFMKNQIRSIERLSKAAELFGMGHDMTKFKPEGAREVKQAGYSFILMKNRLQRYLSERTAMLAGVSHDLRTPLTRMKLQLSMMEENETTKDLQTDISEMEQMLSGYLNFAKGAGKDTMQEISLNTLIKELVEKQKKLKQKIDFHSEQYVSIYAREQDLARAITNILNNSARYAAKTQIRLGIRNNMARILIDDNGPGIPAEKRSEAFKAFYRLDESRNSSTGGVGLGMTIARDIILSHGGEIALDQSPMKGLRVIISLPLAQTNEDLPETPLSTNT